MKYLDKVKQDLIVSKEIFSRCVKYSQKWRFYKNHIKYLEAELKD